LNERHQGRACRYWQAPIRLAPDDRCQLRQPKHPSGRDDAELAQVPPHGIDKLRALADQL
jgi:hypothetical protein